MATYSDMMSNWLGGWSKAIDTLREDTGYGPKADSRGTVGRGTGTASQNPNAQVGVDRSAATSTNKLSAWQQQKAEDETPDWVKEYEARQQQQQAEYEAQRAQQQAEYEAQVAQQEAEAEARRQQEEAERTAREQQAAANQTATSAQNVRDIQHQLERQLENYGFADMQNRALADTQLRQNSAKDNADRFEAQRDFQSAAAGLLGSMGPNAMNSSTMGNLEHMLRQRNDKENNAFWAQHTMNQNAVENAYQDSYNQNNVARRDAMQSAEKAIRDVEGDWRAALNNINPDLFPGGSGSVGGLQELDSYSAWRPDTALTQEWSYGSGYAPRSATKRTTTNNGNVNDYFSQMMSRLSG